MFHPISPSLTNDTLTRPDGSKCTNNIQGELFNYIVCPFGFEAPPNPNCSPTDSAAQALLVANWAECEGSGKYYYGEVVQENGLWCVEGYCKQHSDCPSENPILPAPKKSITKESYEDIPKEAGYDDYNNICRGKPALFYDALGRRAYHNSKIRRHLFTPRTSKSVAKEKELAREGFLKRDNGNLTGQCCVESFSVELKHTLNSPVTGSHVGVAVEFNAQFQGEENNNGCNPSCCEFKQESKGYIFKNGEHKIGTTCKIDGNYVDYDSTSYVQDCYGRDCVHDPSDNREKYYDNFDIYEGSDKPGLNNVKAGDTLDIKMEFNSYIKDKCNAYEVKSSKYWGFHMQGILIEDLDSELDTSLLGEISQ